jgi:hypothetical protein
MLGLLLITINKDIVTVMQDLDFEKILWLYSKLY